MFFLFKFVKNVVFILLNFVCDFFNFISLNLCVRFNEFYFGGCGLEKIIFNFFGLKIYIWLDILNFVKVVCKIYIKNLE